MSPKTTLTQQVLDVLADLQPLQTDALLDEVMRRSGADPSQRLRYRGAVYQLSKIGVIGERCATDPNGTAAPSKALCPSGGKAWSILRAKAPRRAAQPRAQVHKAGEASSRSDSRVGGADLGCAEAFALQSVCGLGARMASSGVMS
jgi:hypothetical protein